MVDGIKYQLANVESWNKTSLKNVLKPGEKLVTFIECDQCHAIEKLHVVGVEKKTLPQSPCTPDMRDVAMGMGWLVNETILTHFDTLASLDWLEIGRSDGHGQRFNLCPCCHETLLDKYLEMGGGK